MPYLSFDLEAKKRATKVARAVGLEPGAVAWGLLELWEHAWEEKLDVVSPCVLAGCVGPSLELPGALAEFGFLERVDGGWRIRGAERYLRITESRSRAGKARAAAAHRDPAGKLVSQHIASTQPAHAGEPASTQPALTPSTEHRAPIETKEEEQEPDLREPDSVGAPLRAPNPPTPLGRTVSPPETPEGEWTGRDFWRWAQCRRQQSGLTPEAEPRDLGGWWQGCLMTEGVTPSAMRDGFNRFGASKFWEKSDPPYPFRAFKKGWSDYVRLEVLNGAVA